MKSKERVKSKGSEKDRGTSRLKAKPSSACWRRAQKGRSADVKVSPSSEDCRSRYINDPDVQKRPGLDYLALTAE